MDSSTIDKPHLPKSWLNQKVIVLLTFFMLLSAGGVGWWLLSNSTKHQSVSYQFSKL